MHTMCVPDAPRGQKKASYSLKLDLEIVMSHHMSAENQTRIFCKSSKYS